MNDKWGDHFCSTGGLALITQFLDSARLLGSCAVAASRNCGTQEFRET
jgi:hypothetical protein